MLDPPAFESSFDFDDKPFTRGEDRRSFGHLPIDGVLIRTFVAEAAVISLADFVASCRRRQPSIASVRAVQPLQSQPGI